MNEFYFFFVPACIHINVFEHSGSSLSPVNVFPNR